jgi:DNA-directed RNA polymerase subunit RPC12/RpoP
LSQHKKRAHLATKRILTCNICKAEYATSIGLRNHLAKHTKSAPDVKCDECDKMFLTKRAMRTHSESMHHRELHCEYCGKIFHKRHHMNEHIKCEHLNVDLKLECRICQKTYQTEMKLANHMYLSHSDVQCPECGETFSNAAKLKRHQLTRHQNLRFRCVVPGCGKEYMTKGKVHDHFKKHDLTPEEREYYDGLRKKLKAT